MKEKVTPIAKKALNDKKTKKQFFLETIAQLAQSGQMLF